MDEKVNLKWVWHSLILFALPLTSNSKFVLWAPSTDHILLTFIFIFTFIFQTHFEDTYHPDVDCWLHLKECRRGFGKNIWLTEDIPQVSDTCPQGVFNRRAQMVWSGDQGGQPVVFGRLVFYILWASFFKHAWIIWLNSVGFFCLF